MACPLFLHYKVFPKLCSQFGVFTEVAPEAIKAQDGDTGINQPVVYSIITGTPSYTLPLFTFFYLTESDREKHIVIQHRFAIWLQIAAHTINCSAVMIFSRLRELKHTSSAGVTRVTPSF